MALIAWSVGLITLVSIGVGSKLPIYVVAGFLMLVAACVILEYSVQVWTARRLFRSRAWDSHKRRGYFEAWLRKQAPVFR